MSKANEILESEVEDIQEQWKPFTVKPEEIFGLKGILNIAAGDKDHAFHNDAKKLVRRLNKHLG